LINFSIIGGRHDPNNPPSRHRWRAIIGKSHFLRLTWGSVNSFFAYFCREKSKNLPRRGGRSPPAPPPKSATGFLHNFSSLVITKHNFKSLPMYVTRFFSHTKFNFFRENVLVIRHGESWLFLESKSPCLTKSLIERALIEFFYLFSSSLTNYYNDRI
jgi:hypothetical protein